MNLAQVLFLKTLGQLVNEVATFAKNLEPFNRLSKNDQRALLNGSIAELVHIRVREQSSRRVAGGPVLPEPGSANAEPGSVNAEPSSAVRFFN